MIPFPPSSFPQLHGVRTGQLGDMIFAVLRLSQDATRDHRSVTPLPPFPPCLCSFTVYAVANTAFFRLVYSRSGPANLWCWFARPDIRYAGHHLSYECGTLYHHPLVLVGAAGYTVRWGTPISSGNMM
jgi:hypothetical protein